MEQALDEIQEAILLDPNAPLYQYLAGALHFRLGDFATATGHLESVIEAEPWHACAHYILAGVIHCGVEFPDYGSRIGDWVANPDKSPGYRQWEP